MPLTAPTITPTVIIPPYQETVIKPVRLRVGAEVQRFGYALELLTVVDPIGVVAGMNVSQTLQTVQLRTKAGMAVVTADSINVAAITYSQSSLWSANTAATNAGMTDGSYNTGTQTGTDPGAGTTSWIQMDLGSVCLISNVVIGCDFDTVLPDGWGPDYAENCLVEVSSNGTTWTPLFTTDTFAAGIETIPVTAVGRYIRINGRPEYDGYMAITEFYATTG